VDQYVRCGDSISYSSLVTQVPEHDTRQRRPVADRSVDTVLTMAANGMLNFRIELV
jgi:hypothetical protein